MFIDFEVCNMPAVEAHQISAVLLRFCAILVCLQRLARQTRLRNHIIFRNIHSVNIGGAVLINPVAYELPNNLAVPTNVKCIVATIIGIRIGFGPPEAESSPLSAIDINLEGNLQLRL